MGNCYQAWLELQCLSCFDVVENCDGFVCGNGDTKLEISDELTSKVRLVAILDRDVNQTRCFTTELVKVQWSEDPQFATREMELSNKYCVYLERNYACSVTEAPCALSFLPAISGLEFFQVGVLNEPFLSLLCLHG